MRKQDQDPDYSRLQDSVSKLKALAELFQGEGNPPGTSDERKEINWGMGKILSDLAEEIRSVFNDLEEFNFSKQGQKSQVEKR